MYQVSKKGKSRNTNMVNCDYSPNVSLKPKTRDGQGLQHDVCGQLLAPIEFDWDNAEHDLSTPVVCILNLLK